MKRILLSLLSLLSLVALLTTPVLALVPAFHTDAATAITDAGATLNAELTDMGGEGSILCNFEYGTSISYGSSTVTDNKTGTGTFACIMSGLTSGVTYHYRSKILYGSTTTYGADESFTTTTTGGLAAPITLDIISVYAYKDYKVIGDRLFLIVYKIVYANDPALDVTDYFELTMTSSGVIKAKIRPTMWGYRVASIYQNAAGALAWQSPCTFTLSGTPSKYGAVPPTISYTMALGDWIGSDKNLIISTIISTADSIGLFYAVAVTDFTAEGKKLGDTQVLLDNTLLSGEELFSNAIKEIRVYCPSLFKVTVNYLHKPDDLTHAQTMRTFTSIDARWGAGTEARLDSLGTYVGGIQGKYLYLMLWIMLMLMMANFLWLGGSPTLAGAGALMMGVVGAYMGADLWIILGISGMVLAFMVFFDYFKNT